MTPSSTTLWFDFVGAINNSDLPNAMDEKSSDADLAKYDSRLGTECVFIDVMSAANIHRLTYGLCSLVTPAI